MHSKAKLFESLLSFYFSKFNIRRIRLVGRGRTIGNRVTCNRVPEFESLILRQINRDTFSCSCLFYFGAELDEIRLCSRRVANRVRKCGERGVKLACKTLGVQYSKLALNTRVNFASFARSPRFFLGALVFYTAPRPLLCWVVWSCYSQLRTHKNLSTTANYLLFFNILLTLCSHLSATIY